MGPPDRTSLPRRFHARVKDWSYARWLAVVVVFALLVTVVSAILRQL